MVTDEANIATLQSNYTTLQYSTGTMKTNSNTTQNTAIVTTYVGGTDNNIMNVNNAAPYYAKISTFNSYTNDASITMNYSDGTDTAINGSPLINTNHTGSYTRVNIEHGTAFVIVNTYFTGTILGGSYNIYFYCSNSSTAYSDTSTTVTSLTSLSSSLSVGTGTYSTAISNSNTYRYVHFLIEATGSGGECTTGTFKVEHQAGGYSNLVAGTDYTVTSDITTGRPTITYTDATTANLTYNLNTLNVYEANRRLYPVIRDASNIILASNSPAISGYAATS